MRTTDQDSPVAPVQATPGLAGHDRAAPAYLYVLVRTDLPHPHLTVQASHAAIAAAVAFMGGKPIQTHPNLVCCGVADEAALVAAFNRLKELGVPCCGWHEDDLAGSLTAVATAPLRGSERKPLRRFKLLDGGG